MKTLSIICLLLFIYFGKTYSQKAELDSISQVYKNKDINIEKRFIALEDYYNLTNQTRPDLALAMLDYHKLIAKERKNDDEMFLALKRKGNILRLKGELNLSMQEYKEAETLANAMNNTSYIADIKGNMGNVYIYRKNYAEATKHFNEALKIYQNQNQREDVNRMLTSLGSVYLIIESYDTALQYYNRVMGDLTARNERNRSLAIIHINIGWTYYKQGFYDKAKTSYLEGLDILESKNDKFFMTNCYSTLASIYLELDDIENAEIYAQKNLDLNKELKIKSGIINAEIIIAEFNP